MVRRVPRRREAAACTFCISMPDELAPSNLHLGLSGWAEYQEADHLQASTCQPVTSGLLYPHGAETPLAVRVWFFQGLGNTHHLSGTRLAYVGPGWQASHIPEKGHVFPLFSDSIQKEHFWNLKLPPVEFSLQFPAIRRSH